MPRSRKTVSPLSAVRAYNALHTTLRRGEVAQNLLAWEHGEEILREVLALADRIAKLEEKARGGIERGKVVTTATTESAGRLSDDARKLVARLERSRHPATSEPLPLGPQHRRRPTETRRGRQREAYTRHRETAEYIEELTEHKKRQTRRAIGRR
jgi:hypothetical protein